MKYSNSIVVTLLSFLGAISSFETNGQAYKHQIYDSTGNKSEVRIGVRFTSDYYYMGRADSARAPYLSPSIGYFHKSGFSIRGSLSYLTAAGEGRIDLYRLSGGYDYIGDKIALGISVSEYFFDDQSYNVQSEMKTYLNAYAGYDFSAFMVYADASLGFSDGTDVFIGTEINRTFYALGNRLRITPAVCFNAGSQKYYSEYYTNRSTQTGKGFGKDKHANQPSSTQTIQISESEKFQLLDYELDLLVSYKIGSVRLYASTTWTFPINPSTVVTDQGTYQEDLENGFFWTSGVQVSF